MVNITVYGVKYFITCTEAINAYAVQILLKIIKYNQSFVDKVKNSIENFCVTSKYKVTPKTPNNNW